MAAALNEVALAGVGTKIHVIGGGVLGVAGPYHQEYDTEKDTWRPRALLPKGLDHIGATVLNGKVYTIGGFVGSVHRDAQNAVYEYDPASDTWRDSCVDESAACVGRRRRARRQDLRRRRAQSGRSGGWHQRSVRSGHQHLEGARAAAEAAGSHRDGGGQRPYSRDRRAHGRTDRQGRSA